VTRALPAEDVLNFVQIRVITSDSLQLMMAFLHFFMQIAEFKEAFALFDKDGKFHPA